jgi:plastocyanin
LTRRAARSDRAGIRRTPAQLLVNPAAIAVLATLALMLPSTARTANPVLIGRDGTRKAHNAYVIRLTAADGSPVTSIPAGTYTLVVHDYSRIHNFALGSQTDNRRLLTTGIRWRGTKTYTLTLTPGSYAYACSAHFRTMNGTFVVTDS